MTRIENIKEKIIAFILLLTFPMFAIQLLPGFTYQFSGSFIIATINASLITALLSIGGYIMLVRAKHEQIPANIPKPVTFLIIAIVVFGMIFVDQIVFTWIESHIVDPGMQMRTEAIASIDIDTDLIPYLLYSLIIAPLSEELLFRVYLYRYMKEYFSWIFAMISTSLMFGLVHLTISHLISATLFGIFLCLILEKTKCIWITIVTHIFYNCMTLTTTGNEMNDIASNTLLSVFIVISVIFVLGWFIAKQDMQFKK